LKFTNLYYNRSLSCWGFQVLSSGLLIDFSITFSYSIMINKLFYMNIFTHSIALPPTSNFRLKKKRNKKDYLWKFLSLQIIVLFYSLFACHISVVVRIYVRYLNKLHNSCVYTYNNKRVLCKSVEFFCSQNARHH